MSQSGESAWQMVVPSAQRPSGSSASTVDDRLPIKLHAKPAQSTVRSRGCSLPLNAAFLSEVPARRPRPTPTADSAGRTALPALSNSAAASTLFPASIRSVKVGSLCHFTSNVIGFIASWVVMPIAQLVPAHGPPKTSMNPRVSGSCFGSRSSSPTLISLVPVTSHVLRRPKSWKAMAGGAALACAMQTGWSPVTLVAETFARHFARVAGRGRRAALAAVRDVVGDARRERHGIEVVTAGGIVGIRGEVQHLLFADGRLVVAGLADEAEILFPGSGLPLLFLSVKLVATTSQWQLVDGSGKYPHAATMSL